MTVSGWPPRWLSLDHPTASRGGQACEFIESFCRVVKDSNGGRAGELLILRPWQRQLVEALLAERPDGRLRHRHALVGMGRKNGKTALVSALALWALLCGPDGAEVYSVAGDKDQARLSFATAKRMIELDPDLEAACHVYRDAIELPRTAGVWRVLSSEAPLKEGLSPTLTLVDEVHVIAQDLWDVFALAQGARTEPLMVGITTAGVQYDSAGSDSLCHRLYQHGQRVVRGETDDPSFFFSWWEPRDLEADHRDSNTWREANPGFGDIVAEEDFATAVVHTPEAEFRTKRCNTFVTTIDTWLPAGAWDALAAPRDPMGDEPAVLALDGSFSQDCIVIVAWLLGGDRPHLKLLGAWERPSEEPFGWTVPIGEVESFLVSTFRRDFAGIDHWPANAGRYLSATDRLAVREVVLDPVRWRHTEAALEEEGLPVIEYPESPQRMVPATQAFFEAVVEKRFTHDGHATLARHVANTTTRASSRGVTVCKKGSNRAIDALVAGIIGYDVASRVQPKPKEVRLFSLADYASDDEWPDDAA